MIRNPGPAALLFLLLSVLIYPQENQGVNKDSTHTIVNSIPEGANVFFNDNQVGVTPLTLFNIPAGTYKVTFKKEGYRDWTHYVFIYDKIINNLTAILDGTYGILDVYSEPSGAKVFIDDSLMGTTPLKNIKLECSRYKIKIQKDGFDDFNIIYPVTPRYFYLLQKLNSVTSNISVSQVAPSIEIKIDGKILNKDSLENRTITTGAHEIEFSGTPLKRSFSKELNLNSDHSYRVELKSHSMDPFYYSAVLPGVGQIHNGSYIKGTSILAGAIVSGIFAISSISNYNDKVEAANFAMEAYKNSRSESYASYYRDLVNSTRSEADKSLNYKRAALGVFLGIYIYNILDALLFESNNYIQVHSKKIKITTDIGLNSTVSDYKLNFNVPIR